MRKYHENMIAIATALLGIETSMVMGFTTSLKSNIARTSSLKMSENADDENVMNKYSR